MLAGVNGASSGSAALERERSSFGADRLARIAEIEGSHFWFAGRRALVQRLLDRHVQRGANAALDVGCGTGSFLPVLSRYADRVVGVDPLGGHHDEIIAGEAEHLPFEQASFDLAVALDVLEHVDDRAAVRELARVLRPGGWAIVTVPAFPGLWSERDELAAHRRRYRRAALVDLFESAGFAVAETAYYQFMLFPLVLVSRAVGRVRPRTTELEEQPAPRVNRLLRRLCELEVQLGTWVRWPWGSTLAIAARRRAA
jgi:SAM-dependent methyltransferase